MDRLPCAGAALAETFLPGAGFALSGSWDKALILGGARWATINQYSQAIKEAGYQEKADQIYVIRDYTETASQKNELEIYYNLPTWNANYYGSLAGDLWLISLSDLYANSCEQNNETYGYLAAPLQIGHFYDNWMFYPPILLALYSYQTFDQNSTANYYLGMGLSEGRLKQDAFSQYYLVGVGEEMFFRGVVQNWFFGLYGENFGLSKELSRHLAVWSGAAVFGAAHNGQGLSAAPGGAFFMGAYLGYSYQPSLDEFDLTTAIAIHAWWNILVTYAVLNHATFTETEKEVQVPLLNVAFQF